MAAPRDMTAKPMWRYLWPAGAIALSALVLQPTLHNGWVNYDDRDYVLNNTLIHHLSGETVATLFGTFELLGNYQPLTYLSLAVDYALYETDASGYHVTNLLLHLVNVGLVYWLFLLISGRPVVAGVTAMLFGMHPMHVESVAWISARKDVLYAFFMLGAAIAYELSRQRSAKQGLLYGTALLLFVLSLLSKGMAVVLPLLLLAFDYLKERTDWQKQLLHKAPFFALAIGFGVLSLLTQAAAGGTGPPDYVAAWQGPFIAAYGWCYYVWQSLMPTGLSAFHPYPESAGSLPPSIYLGAIGLVAIAALIWWKARSQHWLLFGLAFFTVAIAPVLQLIPVGDAIVAERYTYVAYLGLFFVVGWLAHRLLNSVTGNWSKLRMIGLPVIGLYIAVMGFATFQRASVWEDGRTLWSDVIKQYPNHHFAYGNRGSYWLSEGRADLAIKDFDRCIQRKPNFVPALLNRGLLFTQQGNADAALADFNRAIASEPENAMAHFNRGILYMNTNQHPQAIADFSRSIELDTTNWQAYLNRGVIYKRTFEHQLAINDYNAAIALQPEMPSLYYNRGFALCLLGDLNAGEADFSKAIALDPAYAKAYTERSKVYHTFGQLDKAMTDALKARELGAEIPDYYLEQLKHAPPK